MHLLVPSRRVGSSVKSFSTLFVSYSSNKLRFLLKTDEKTLSHLSIYY